MGREGKGWEGMGREGKGGGGGAGKSTEVKRTETQAGKRGKQNERSTEDKATKTEPRKEEERVGRGPGEKGGGGQKGRSTEAQRTETQARKGEGREVAGEVGGERLVGGGGGGGAIGEVYRSREDRNPSRKRGQRLTRGCSHWLCAPLVSRCAETRHPLGRPGQPSAAADYTGPGSNLPPNAGTQNGAKWHTTQNRPRGPVWPGGNGATQYADCGF